MSKGTDYQVIIWVVIMILWGLGKFLGTVLKNAKNGTPRKKVNRPPRPIMQNLTQLIEQQAQQFQLIETSPPEEEVPEAPPPPIKQQPKRRERQSVFDEIEAPEPPARSATQFGSFNAALRTSSSALRMPRVQAPTMSVTETNAGYNPLRPVWKSPNDIKKAVLASVILQRPQY